MTEASLTDLARSDRLGEAGQAIRWSAEELSRSPRSAAEVDAATAGQVATVLRESGGLSPGDEVQREAPGDGGLLLATFNFWELLQGHPVRLTQEPSGFNNTP